MLRTIILRTIVSWILLTIPLAACRMQAPLVEMPAPTGTPNAAIAQIPTPTAPTATSTPTVPPTATPLPTATFVPLDPTATLAPLSNVQREEIFNRVWTAVRDNYVYEDYRGLDWNAIREEFAAEVANVTTPEAFYGLLRTMILRLNDEHSRFESPQDVALEEALFNGELNYGGIGAIVRTIDEGGLIIGVAEDGPAAEAGLQPRDLIVAVNSIPFTDTTAFGPGGPISVVRGIPGSTVMLRVRSTDQAPREVEVVRRVIPASAFPDVESQRLPNTSIGLLRIYTFNADNLDQTVRQHLDELTQTGPLDGLIIDVRSNGGGRVDLMLNTIALFVDGGTIGSQQGRAFQANLEVPRGETLPQLANVPVVVLTSEESVSAAEMFAAGMQVLGRARVIGTATAGNTENLRPYNFLDGSRLWLAELTYVLPDGNLIEGQGVQPDRVVDVAWWEYELAQDPQIQAAIEELQELGDGS